MKNRFLLWKAALDRDLIKLDIGNGDSELFPETTKAAAALTRVVAAVHAARTAPQFVRRRTLLVLGY